MGRFADSLRELREQHRLRSLRFLESPQGRQIQSEGRTYLNFASNNYLGLAEHPALAEAIARGIRDYGVGSGASRLINGSMGPHRRLEERLAAFKGTEAALLFNSGYHANLGALGCLADAGDVIFSDALNHASMIDGMRLSRAEKIIYRHNDLEDLEEKLREARQNSGENFLIATESVFSMDGDLAPLEKLADLAVEYDALLYVDEAHATGVFGEQGAGCCEALRGHPVFFHLVQMGTLGKALGCFGAYVAASREIVDFLVNFSRPFIYTTALPPTIVEAARAALEIVRTEPERRERLWRKVELTRNLLHEAFPQPSPKVESPIIPFVIGDAGETVALSQGLKDAGFWINAIRPPTVPDGSSRLRMTLMATHEEEDIRSLVEALAKNFKPR